MFQLHAKRSPMHARGDAWSNWQHEATRCTCVPKSAARGMLAINNFRSVAATEEVAVSLVTGSWKRLSNFRAERTSRKDALQQGRGAQSKDLSEIDSRKAAFLEAGQGQRTANGRA
ncbi:MAG: hypothetical protein KatS3mg111_2561 [Pirellulaceae bacterium]|nr:MAG: hypothetical protein KatS3mg111_2561 [Pirellulaceae bacterium]